MGQIVVGGWKHRVTTTQVTRSRKHQKGDSDSDYDERIFDTQHSCAKNNILISDFASDSDSDSDY